MIYLTITFITISAIAKGFTDAIRFKGSNFIFANDWWLERGQYSWDSRTFWEKYVFSFVSGGWHCMDMIRIVSMLLAVIVCPIELHNWLMIIGFVVLGYIWHGLVFELTYKIL
jgi:hypothetical protein